MLMTTDQIILKAICDHSPEWTKRYIDPLLEWGNWEGAYMPMMDIGSEIAYNLAHGKDLQVIRNVFATLETLIPQYKGNIEVSSLLGLGLFSAIEVRIRTSDPDLIEKYMGPNVLQAWGDYISAYGGKTVRKLSQLRRLLVLDGVRSIRIVYGRKAPKSEISITSEMYHAFPRMLYDKDFGKLDVETEIEMGLNEPFADVFFEVTNSAHPKVLLIGNRVKDDEFPRFASYEGRTLIVNLEAYLVQLLEE
jgi:hypothetical protein